MIFPMPEGTEIKGTDVEKFRESNLPPTYFAYGSRDPFVGEFEECIEALEEATVCMRHGKLAVNCCLSHSFSGKKVVG